MTNVDIEFLQITSQGGSLFKLYAVFIGGRLLLKDGLCMRKFPNHSTILSILLAIFRLFSVKLLDHHSQNPNLAKKFCLEGPGVSHLFSKQANLASKFDILYITSVDISMCLCRDIIQSPISLSQKLKMDQLPKRRMLCLSQKQRR